MNCEARPTTYKWVLQTFAAAIILMLTGCTQKPTPIARQHLTLESLVQRMSTTDSLAQPPLGPSYLSSSYDRNGGNMDWMVWRKTDAEGHIPLLDLQGPGYVSRIWIASFQAKTWLFYFDDETEPRLALSNDELFGGAFPFTEPLAGKSGGGKYSLVPIPFDKRLRIKIEPNRVNPGDRNYYQINYTLTPDHTAESFPQVMAQATSNRITQAMANLNAATTDPPIAKPHTTHRVAARGSSELFKSSGRGIIEEFSLQVNEPSPNDPQFHDMLRSTRLQVFWDKKRAPSIDVPLGDFFCTPFYKRNFNSLPLVSHDGTYTCRLPMPYNKGARIVILNSSSSPIEVSAAISQRDATESDPTRLLHGKWAATTTSGRPFVMGKLTGPGHYIGCLLTAIGQDGSWNILEGDEAIVADGDRTTGQYGTGLEDYFSGAYYYTSLFDLPFHGLIEKGAMRTDQYRFHSLDAVPFAESLDMTIEFGHGNLSKGYMSSVVYWYADTPADASIPADQHILLARPADRFALAGMMAQLFTLERDGLWSDAAARCRYYAMANRNQPWSSIFDLRAEACKTFIEGEEPDYTRFLNDPFPHTARQAQDLAWQREAPDHALLGIHTRGTCSILVDGQLVAQTKGPESFTIRRLKLADGGAHTWEVKTQPTHQGSFVALCLRTGNGDITSFGPWEQLAMTPVPDKKPPEEWKGGQALPNMTVWQFQPNALPAMQSPAHGIATWAFWDGTPRVQTVHLKQTWTNALEHMDRAMPTEIKRTEAEERAHAVD